MILGLKVRKVRCILKVRKVRTLQLGKQALYRSLFNLPKKMFPYDPFMEKGGIKGLGQK